MESIANKVTLYDLFSVWLSGIIALVSTIFFIEDNFEIFLLANNNEFLDVFFFLIISYTIGLALQEIGSISDRNITKIKTKIDRGFLSQKNNVITNTIEFDNYYTITKEILHENHIAIIDNKVTPDMMQFSYHYCVAQLRFHNADNSYQQKCFLYAMSRSLYLLYFFIFMCLCFTDFYGFIYKKILLIFLIYIFYHRSYRFAKIKILTAFQSYPILKNNT
ncbi:hypothetical protein NDGK_02946 [Clostridiales bacterium CHKCI001]|nr:hypothetical protein NDGK_02946 [Clostridiales bacterium CHKCI001]